MSENDARIDRIAEDVAYMKGHINSELESIKKDNSETRVILKQLVEMNGSMMDLQSRVKRLENGYTWLYRTVCGALIGIGISAFIYLLTGMNF